MAFSIRWFPPAWVQVVNDGKILYIDPAYLRTYYLNHPDHIEISKWPDPIDGLPERLSRADAILITHHHKDHVKALTVGHLQAPGTAIIGPARCAKLFDETIDVVKPGDQRSVAGFGIEVVEAYNLQPQHPDGRVHHKKGVGVGYIVEVAGTRIFHAGDSDFIPEMKHIGRIDVAFLPIDGTFTMPAEHALLVVKAINPALVVAMHWMKTDPLSFIGRAKRSGFDARLPSIGETVFKK